MKLVIITFGLMIIALAVSYAMEYHESPIISPIPIPTITIDTSRSLDLYEADRSGGLKFDK